MIDNLFTAALALTLLVGGTVAIGSTLQETPRSNACATRAQAQVHALTTAQVEALKPTLR
jgi:hypothetical protein